MYGRGLQEIHGNGLSRSGIKEEKREADHRKAEQRARREDRKRPVADFLSQSLEALPNEIFSGLEVQKDEEDKTDVTDLATAS